MIKDNKIMETDKKVILVFIFMSKITFLNYLYLYYLYFIYYNKFSMKSNTKYNKIYTYCVLYFFNQTYYKKFIIIIKDVKFKI